jgi:cytochrome oxidase Cu insertion factor (SCO1/SenC/PrrC family)
MSSHARAPRALVTLIVCASTLSLSAVAVAAQTTRRFSPRPEAAARAAVQYVCPMHPEVKAAKPGRCPKCHMNLRRADASASTTAEVKSVAASPVAAASVRTEESGAQLRVPDTAVIDQDGRRLNFYTDLVRGRTVAINFIFTTCTTICPPLTATFRKVQQQLGARAGRDVHLISVSVDPTTDVPERLKSFSQKFGAGPDWTFVTGSKPAVDQLLKSLGASVGDKNDHTPMILVGNDAAGYWTRTYGLAPAATILKTIDEAAGKTPAASGGAASAPAPKDDKAEFKKTLASKAASYFPNTALLTQDGKEVRFYEDLLKGKIVLINFVFTTCKGTCSPMTANLAKVQSYLGEHVGREVAMISVSVDPETDTPAALKRYADSFKAQPGWYFLTGTKENVSEVLRKLGGFVEDKNEHSLALIIGNEATGDWMKLHSMANPKEISASVMRLIESKKN